MSGQARLTVSGTRDLRLDFVRGMALYMILVDHVANDPISKFTYRVIGYSDAAEIFVFVSGLACGIVYFRLLANAGWLSLFSTIAKRAARIYFYYILTGLAVMLLLALARSQIDTTALERAREFVYPSGFLAALGYLFPVTGILLLYLPLTLVVMPLFFWGARRNAPATLGVSAAIYVISQLFPQLGSTFNLWIGLNPLAWQFLFALGLFFGMGYSDPTLKPFGERFRWLVFVAWVIVVGSFILRFSVFIAPRFGHDFDWARIPLATVLQMKAILSPIRLIHFLSVAVLFAAYVQPMNAIVRSYFAKPFIAAGRHSLEMFSVSVVISIAAGIFVAAKTPSLPAHLLLDAAMIATMTLVAFMITRSDRMRSAFAALYRH